MIKRLLLILGVALFLSSCGKDVSYRIEGKLSNLEDETLYAVFENDNYKVVDTITCEKPGQFSLKRNEGDFNTVTIFFDNKKCWTTAYLMKGEKVRRCSLPGFASGERRTCQRPVEFFP